MVSATSTAGTTTYQLNALGQRVRKTNSSDDTVFSYDSRGHLIAESTAAGGLKREYVWLGDMPLAVSEATGTYFVHVDHLNSPRLISNAAGQTVWKWDQQEPFGVSPPDKNPSGLGVFDFPLRHAGQYEDSETGLFYNYLRDCYDPVLGRYCQADPIGLAGGSLSLYPYVANNPLAYIDPLGLATTIPGPGGVPVPVPVPPSGGPGSSPGSGGKGGLIPPELDPNRPQPKTFPEIRVPPFPPSSPPPQGKSICEHLFNQCIKGAEVCPPPITQVGRAFCLAAYIICITISGSGGSGGDPTVTP